METRFQEFKEDFRGDIQALLGQYFGPPPSGPPVNVDKRKGVLGAPPRFLPKDTECPKAPVDPKLTDASSVHQRNQFYMGGTSTKTCRLDCLRFDDNDFRGWWTKLDQYFEANGTLESDKIPLLC
ncbi:hypothetical protein PVK06_035185 [Gossypium arboreum]|uniref:Uncharacterized protein n=1 Tax=Gossypium arboreum TaxID=29729 RepID=A0ABR0NIG0_GOSAR|nr:hypothetical protein PVK06_035185 [Gossypium arboreum]